MGKADVLVGHSGVGKKVDSIVDPNSSRVVPLCQCGMQAHGGRH